VCFYKFGSMAWVSLFNRDPVLFLGEKPQPEFLYFSMFPEHGQSASRILGSFEMGLALLADLRCLDI